MGLELGSVDFVGKSLTNMNGESGLGLLSVCQDSRTDLFGGSPWSLC